MLCEGIIRQLADWHWNVWIGCSPNKVCQRPSGLGADVTLNRLECVSSHAERAIETSAHTAMANGFSPDTNEDGYNT